jgi:MFS family permease
MTTPSRPLFNANLRWFLLTMIIANIAGEMVFGLLPIYLMQLGASVSQVGLVFTLAALVPIVLQILGGWLSDIVGRLRVIAYASSVAAMSYLIFLVAPRWEWILAGICLDYVSTSVVSPGFNAYIASQSSEADRGRVFGLSQSLYAIVNVIGPVLGGFLAYRFGFQAMISVALIFYAIATGLRIWMARTESFEIKSKGPKPSLKLFKAQITPMIAFVFSGSLLTWVWVTETLGDVSYSGIENLYPIYLEEIGRNNLGQIGALNAILGLAMVVSSFIAGVLIDKYGERRLIAVGFLLEGVGLWSMTRVTTFPEFVITTSLFGLGSGILLPAYDSFLSKAVPENKQGLIFGFFGTTLGILSLPFPWLGAQLWEKVSPQLPFLIVFGVCLISALVVWTRFKLEKISHTAKTESG